MADGTCSIEGCDRVGKISREMCMMHYQRWSKTDTTKIKASPTCSIEGCIKAINSRGLCPMHYMRWRASVAEQVCDIEGCERKVYARGWCEAHYQRWRVHGTTDDHYLRLDSGYGTTHDRVRRDRGPARDQVCIDCGNPAHHWSYDHEDPDEQMSRFGRSYSLDNAHYWPRCRSCHTHFDNDHHAQ